MHEERFALFQYRNYAGHLLQIYVLDDLVPGTKFRHEGKVLEYNIRREDVPGDEPLYWELPSEVIDRSDDR